MKTWAKSEIERKSKREILTEGVMIKCMSVCGMGDELSTHMENGPVACSAHSCPLAEWGSNRAFCLQHKDVANVSVSSTH